METTGKRPVYLNLLTIRLPIGGVVSITHRITGVLLILSTPFALYLLQQSLQSEAQFERTRALLGSSAGRIGVLVVLWIFAQHFFSGVRHLLLDVHIGVERQAARRSAWLTFVAGVLTVAASIVWMS